MSPAVVRRFVSVFVLSAGLLGAIVAVLYVQDLRHERAILAQQGRFVVDLEREFLSRELNAVKSDLLFLARQPGLRRLLSGDAAARKLLEEEYSSFARTKAVYHQIRCLDTAGDEVIRINYRDGVSRIVGSDELQPKADRYYFRDALSLAAGEIFVSPLDLNLEHGKIERPIRPVIRFLTPVFDEAGRQRGLFVLNFLGGRLLAKLEEISAGSPGETMLVSPTGEYLQAPGPGHSWGWMLGHEHSFRRRFPTVWEQLAARSEGQIEAVEGLFTFHRVSPGRNDLTGPTGIDRDPSSLLLISYVPRSVITARSRNLLRQLLLLYLAAGIPVLLLTLYWARAAATRQEQERRLQDSESRLRKLSSGWLAAQEEERRSISRDLHDELGQLVTAINLDLKSALRDCGDGRVAALLERAVGETHVVLDSLHKIASRVRPTVLDDLGLRDAVESFVEEYEQRTGVAVQCDLQLDDRRIPPAVGENAYRILQEALANAAAHGRCDSAQVTIKGDRQQLEMTIEDSGSGFEPAQQSASRLGILGMQERAELLGGRFQLASAPQKGTRIDVTIPLEMTHDDTASRAHSGRPGG